MSSEHRARPFPANGNEKHGQNNQIGDPLECFEEPKGRQRRFDDVQVTAFRKIFAQRLESLLRVDGSLCFLHKRGRKTRCNRACPSARPPFKPFAEGGGDFLRRLESSGSSNRAVSPEMFRCTEPGHRETVARSDEMGGVSL